MPEIPSADPIRSVTAVSSCTGRQVACRNGGIAGAYQRALRTQLCPAVQSIETWRSSRVVVVKFAGLQTAPEGCTKRQNTTVVLVAGWPWAKQAVWA